MGAAGHKEQTVFSDAVALSGEGATRSRGLWLAIVNPMAGALRDKAFWRKWIPRLERAVATMQYTSGPDHATALARAASTYDGIVAVGGDGTIKEVVAGMDRARQFLAVVPAGRGNNLARELGVAEIDAALASIAAGRSQRVDLIAFEMGLSDGTIAPGLATSALTIGYVTRVAQQAERFRQFGAQAYAVATLFTRPEVIPMEISYDDAAPCRRQVTGIVINNTSHLANFQVFPRASASDGRVDVLELNGSWASQTLHNLSILTRMRVYEPGRMMTANCVNIRLARPATLLADGEIYVDVVTLKARCLREGLSCRRPPSP